MNHLKPIGVEVILDGKSRHFLFTFNAIYDIQEHFEKSIEEVFDGLTDPNLAKQCLQYIVYALLTDEYERETSDNNKTLKKYSLREVGWLLTQDNYAEILIAVLKSYGVSLPEPDEFENPNIKSATQKKKE